MKRLLGYVKDRLVMEEMSLYIGIILYTCVKIRVKYYDLTKRLLSDLLPYPTPF